MLYLNATGTIKPVESVEVFNFNKCCIWIKEVYINVRRFEKNLTLTSVVFEYKTTIEGYFLLINLTLTSVVFEFFKASNSLKASVNLTLTSVVFEFIACILSFL